MSTIPMSHIPWTGLPFSGVLWSATALLLTLFILPLAFATGFSLLRFLLRVFGVGEASAGVLLLSDEGLLQSFCFGLLVLLTAMLLLLSFGLSWNTVTATILAVGGIGLTRGWPALELAARRGWKGAAHLNFAFWLFAVLVIGATLIGRVRGLSTPWVNNYGDVAWHLGLITSFTFGTIFPPEYQIFPGERLSYPFYVNLWTASSWWMAPNWWVLVVLFFLQWSVCWIVIYAALRGNRNWMLPWAVLFGGGASILLYRMHPLLKPWKDLGGYAHNLLERGFPWAPFITTVWVTQRPALFGAMVVLGCLGVFHRFVITAKERREIRGGLILALCPLSISVLAHTHLFMVTSLYIAIWLILSFADSLRLSVTGWFDRARQGALQGEGPGALAALRAGLFSGLLLLPSVAFFPVIWGKRSILGFTPGWLPWRWLPQGKFFAAIGDSFMLWLTNAQGWLVAAIALLLFLPKRRELLALFFVFLLGNTIRTSYWEWDQIKVFLGIYIAFMSLWAYSELRFPALSLSLRKLQACCLLLVVPGISEFADEFFYRYQNFTVYSELDEQIAAAIREITPPNSIILAAADHNSPVTLSGRRLFEGYNGTLSSHGLDYAGREALFKDFEKVLHCREPQFRELVNPKNCPRYLVWTEREKRVWPGKDPAQVQGLKKTASEYLWEIPEDLAPLPRPVVVAPPPFTFTAPAAPVDTVKVESLPK